MFVMGPNPPLNSDPACFGFRSLSTSRFLGFVHRLGAGGAGLPHSIGIPMKTHPDNIAPTRSFVRYAPRATTWRNAFSLIGLLLVICFAAGCGGGSAGGGTPNQVVSPTAPNILVTPIICPSGSPSFPFSLYGFNFNSTSIILVNNKECPTTYFSPGRLTAVLNSADIFPTSHCQVRNSTPTSELSEMKQLVSANFTTNSLNPITSPTKVAAGSASFTLAFWGISMDADSVIVWNGLAMPTALDVSMSYASTTIAAQEVAKPGYAVAALYSNKGGWITPPQIVNITLNQPVCGMVESPTGGSLLAIVPDSSTSNPSSLIQIEPNTGQVTSMLTLGKSPSALAVASDKGSIYMGSTQSNLVQRLAWPGLAKVSEIDLGSSGTASLVAIPGSPSSILVGQTTFFPPAQEVVIYDDGRPRGLHGGVYGYRDCIAIDESAGKVYALNNGLSAFDVEAYTVDGYGLTSIGRSGRLDIGFGTGIAVSGGKLYTTSGLLIDSNTLAPLSKRIVRTSNNRLLIDSPNNRIYFVGPSGFYGLGYLVAYDLTTLNQVGVLALNGMLTTPQCLVRWGRNGLAVVPDSAYGNDSTMYVFQTDLVRPF